MIVAVRLLKIDLRHERLMRLQVAPLVRIEWLAVVREVPVRLGRPFEPARFGEVLQIRCVVSGIAHEVGQDADTFGQLIAVITMRAMVVSADRGLVTTGDQG